MTIDWAKLKSSKPKVSPMFAIIFGASGAGKSTALGTTGLSTLLLHGPTENHAGTNARLMGKGKIF
jgi:ABC-type lipoprotein export system ATPase subunit